MRAARGAPAVIAVLLALLLPARAVAAEEGTYSLARCLELARAQSFDVQQARVELGTRLAVRDLRGYLGLPEGETMVLADALAPPLDPAPLIAHVRAGVPLRLELQLLAKAVEVEELKTSLKRGEHLPTVSIGASVLRLDIQGVPGQTNVLGFGLVSVPLSGWWEGHHAVKSQEKQAQLARRRLHEVRRFIGLEVTKRWDELQTAWQQTAVADLGVAQAETNVTEVTDRHRSGLAPFSDVLEAQALRQQALDRKLEVRKDYWLKRSAFLRAAAREERPQPTSTPNPAGSP
jgi:outer membrane protein